MPQKKSKIDQQTKTKVFLSYSRKDGKFAEDLRDRLINSGFDAYLDKHDILPGEPWKERLGGLIATADTVVFCMSPLSIASEMVDWEVNRAEMLNKRIIPVVVTDPDEEAVPERLKRLNYIFLRNEAERADEYAKLIGALDIDIAWVREHTRLGTLAQHWEANKHPLDMVLRGKDLTVAETWLINQPKNAPDPTEAHRAFITESHRAATGRQRMKLALSLTATLVAVGLAGLAYLQREDAIKERDSALTTQSRFLADLAEQYIEGSDPIIGAQLALEALPDKRDNMVRPYVTEAEHSLYRGLYSLLEVVTLQCKESVDHVSFSSDGRLVLTASSDGVARLWNASDGELIFATSAHKSNMKSIAALSPNGTRIVTGSLDQSARLWDVKNGRLIADLAGHKAWVKHVEFSLDGKKILTASGSPFHDDNSVRIWDAENGKRITHLIGHSKPVNHATFSPDGKLVATASDDVTVRLWDSHTGHELKVLRNPQMLNMVLNVQFSVDGSKLLASPLNGSAVVWDVSSGKIWRQLTGSRDYRDAKFSPDGRYIIASNSKHAVVIFDTKQAKNSRSFQALSLSPIRKLRISALNNSGKSFEVKDRIMSIAGDGKRLVTAAEDGIARMWDIQTGTRLRAFKGHKAKIVAITISPDGLRLLTGSDDGTARIWRLDHPDHLVLPDLSAIEAIALSGNGDRLLGIAPRSKSVRIWNHTKGTLLGTIKSHTGPVRGAAFISGGSRILTIAGERGDDDNLARIFDATSLSLIDKIPGKKGPFSNFAVSPDGSHIALVEKVISNRTKTGYGSRDDNSILLVNTKKLSQRRLLTGHDGSIWSIRFSPDGLTLASTGRDRTVRLWNVVTGTERLTLRGHTGGTSNVAYSPDGTLIASSSQDRTLRIWSTSDGILLHKLEGHRSSVNHIVFSADGKRLASSAAQFRNDNQEVLLWNVGSGRQILRLEAHAGGLGEFAQFSNDGRRLLTLGLKKKDKTGRSIRVKIARIWDLATASPIVSVENIAGKSALLDKNGDHLLVGLTDGTIRVLRLFPTSQEVMDRTKNALSRCMTPADREKAFLSTEIPKWCRKFATSPNKIK